MQKNRGFTLVEILIALTIFAIISIMFSLWLRHSIVQTQRLNQYMSRLSSMQRLVILLRRDTAYFNEHTHITASSNALLINNDHMIVRYFLSSNLLTRSLTYNAIHSQMKLGRFKSIHFSMHGHRLVLNAMTLHNNAITFYFKIGAAHA